MKKKLEAELISIAHRILKLKNKSELDQLHTEAQKLYEKLSILKFVEENFAGLKPTIGQTQANEILETAFDEPTIAEEKQPETVAETAPAEETQVADISADSDKPKEDKPEEEIPVEKEPETQEQEKIQEPSTPPAEKVTEENRPLETPLEKEVEEVIADAENDIQSGNESEETVSAEEPEKKPEETVAETPTIKEGINFDQPEAKEEVAAAVGDKVKEEDLFKPTFEWAFEAKSEEIKEEPKAPTSQIAFDDLLGSGYKDPVFVKPEELAKEGISYTSGELPKQEDVISISRRADKVPVFKMNNNEFDKSVSLNDRLSKGITVGLNDRIAFVKNLFNNSNEEYNRVLSQLITYDTFAEAQDFIDNMVKPDYNNWDGKDEYAQRFMEVVEKKFS